MGGVACSCARLHSRPISPLATIHQDKHFTVQHFRASAHVRVIRSDAPFETTSDAITGLDKCRLVLAGMRSQQYGILFDWRNAPLSTDSDLHKALTERVDGLAERFLRRAFLVRAGVGVMQVNRIGRTISSGSMTIFDDEATALAFLIGRR